MLRQLLVLGLLWAIPHSQTYGSEACRYVKRGEWVLQESAMGPAIEGQLNELPVRLLFDTGAELTTLFEPAANRLGLHLIHSDDSLFGIGGEAIVYLAKPRKIAIGPVQGEAAFFLPVTSDLFDKPELDGIAGSDFLLRNDVELDLSAGKTRFFTPLNCKDDNLAYWDADPSSIPMHQLTPNYYIQIIEIKLNGKPVRALIDSGASTTVIDVSALRRMGIKADISLAKPTMNGLGKHLLNTAAVTFDSLSVGDEIFFKPTVDVGDLWANFHADAKDSCLNDIADRPPVLLGADFLRAHRVLFAVSQQRFYFSYVKGKVFSVEPKWLDPAPSSQ